MRQRNSTKTIKQIIEGQPERFKKLIRTAASLATLQEALDKELPNTLTGKVRVRYYRSGILSVNVHSGVAATILRIQEDNIRAALTKQHSFRNLNKIEVKVRPQSTTENSENRTKAISRENARLLRDVAGSITDESLRNSLEKLASRVLPDPPVD